MSPVVVDMYEAHDEMLRKEKRPKVFIGTEPRMWLGTAVLKHTINKFTSVPVEIQEMDHSLDDPAWHDWRIGRPHGIPATRNRNELGELVWFTDFTCFRWASPEKCNFQGRAIYNDVDQIYLGDVKELWDLDMDGKAVLSLTTNETSVLLFDCEKFANLDWWPSIEEMKASNWGIKHYIQLLWNHDMFGILPTRWNCLDGRGYAENWTRLIHYTDMSSQPWRPYPERLSYRPHPVPITEELWMDFYYEAQEAGTIPDSPPSEGTLPAGVADLFSSYERLWRTEHKS